MAILERLIDVTFRKETGAFIESGTNEITLSGHRVSAKISKAGGVQMSSLSLDVWGMTFSEMNQLSTLGMAVQLVQRNTVIVTAGDNENGMSIVFVGTITNAWGNFQTAPDTPFHVEATAGIAGAVVPIPPSSFPHGADVATVIGGLVPQMPGALTFENNNVRVQLPPSYFAGSPRQQAWAAARAADINIVEDDGKIAIWNKYGARGSFIPEVSVDSGMVNYPTYTAFGIMVKTIFNPSISFGGKIKVVSSLPPASKEWGIYSLEHSLEANMPGGDWFSMVGCYFLGTPRPAVQ